MAVLVGRAFRNVLDRLSGANRWRHLGERPTSCTRFGDFVCDRHWAMVTETQDGDDPIHAWTVNVGLMAFLHAAGVQPVPGEHVFRACCLMPEEAFLGILERARTSYWAKR